MDDDASGRKVFSERMADEFSAAAPSCRHPVWSMLLLIAAIGAAVVVVMIGIAVGNYVFGPPRTGGDASSIMVPMMVIFVGGPAVVVGLLASGVGLKLDRRTNSRRIFGLLLAVDVAALLAGFLFLSR